MHTCVYMHIYNESELFCHKYFAHCIGSSSFFFFFFNYFIFKEYFLSKHKNSGVPAMARWVKNPTAVAQLAGEVWVPSLTEGVKVSVVATAAPQIQTLAWELLFAIGVAIKFK